MSTKRIGSVVCVGMMLLHGSALPGWAMGSGGFHGGGFHGRGFHDGHGFVHNRIVIGVPFVGGDPFWWGPGPYDAMPPVVVQSAPSTYWYYCQNPAGYYPAVPACPGGWMTVVPQAPWGGN